MTKRLVIEGRIFKYQGTAAWYFLSTTKEQGEALKKEEKRRIGWGAKRVEATLGTSVFRTSLFPTKEGPYLLPIKKSVREKEGVGEKSTVRVTCVFI